MKDFLDIVSFYSGLQDRTIDNLSKVYHDTARLENSIRDLFNKHISESSVKGKRVLLKPNWVKHSSKSSDEICLRTHDQFTLAVLKIVLENGPSEIVIGDAPIQGCKWEKMISGDFLKSIRDLSQKYNIPVHVKDFRRVTFDTSLNNLVTERNPLSAYLIFDLGKQSYLEPISGSGRNRFRVTNYNPDRFIDSHGPGMHKYCITRELFDADVVISLPKVKTHQKSGITAALKNIVGLNGDKDFLPHHRIGGEGIGGDCYPGKNPLRYWAELASDNANRNRGKTVYWFWIRLSSLLWRLSLPTKVHDLAAAWYGNDTTWRMVMDLNQIATLGKSDGSLSDLPQRKMFSFCDGIIGGQSDGPLKPEPLPLGIICLSNNSGITDLSMATLMGFDFRKIPLLTAAYKLLNIKEVDFIFNSSPIQFDELRKHSIVTLPPPGWIEYLKD